MAAATGLCNFMNQELDLSGYACETVAAPGPEDGLRALRAGAVDLAFVDSNLVDNATDRLNLRTVLTMFPKLLTVATSKRSAIRIEDLHRSKVAVGPTGSQSARLFDIMQENRLFRSRFELERVTLSSQQARIEALCSGSVDAAAFVVSHPSVRIDDLADSCEVEIISVCCDRKQDVSESRSGLSERNHYRWFLSRFTSVGSVDRRSVPVDFCEGTAEQCRKTGRGCCGRRL